MPFIFKVPYGSMVGEQSGEWLDASIARVLGFAMQTPQHFNKDMFDLGNPVSFHPQVEEAPTVATVANIYMHICICICICVCICMYIYICICICICICISDYATVN